MIYIYIYNLFFKKKNCFYLCYIYLFLINDILYYNVNYTFNNIENIFYNNEFWCVLYYLNNNNNNLIIFLLLLLIHNAHSLISKTFLILMFLLNITLNECNFLNFFQNSFENNILFNGLLLIHPFFIYITYISLYNFLKKKNYFNYINVNVNKIIKYSILSIVLGAFWAQQEFNWGGWWNWDFVELLTLVVFIKLIFILHFKKNLIFFKKIKLNYFYLLVIFYIIVRCDFLNSVHSFNSVNILEKFSNYIYIFMILLLFSLFFKNFFFFFKFNLNKEIGKNYTLIFFSFLFILLIYYNIIYFFFIYYQLTQIDFFLKNILFMSLTIYSVLNTFNKINFFFKLLLVFLNNYIFIIILIFQKILENFFINKKLSNKKTIIIIHILISICILIFYYNNIINAGLVHFNDLNIIFFNNINTVILEKTKYFFNIKINSIFNTLVLDKLIFFDKSLINEVYSNIILFNNDILYKLNGVAIKTLSFNLNLIFLYTTLTIITLYLFYYKSIKVQSDIV